MAKQIIIKVKFTDDGKATISIPHGKNQQADAGAAADLTDKLSKALGKVTERHIGDHVHEHGDGMHTHEDGTVHGNH
jgi:hypothetical protein